MCEMCRPDTHALTGKIEQQDKRAKMKGTQLLLNFCGL